MVDFQQLLAFGCFVGTAIQTVIDAAAWQEGRRRRKGQIKPSKMSILWPVLWILGPVITVAIGVALLMYHPKSSVQARTDTVEKTIPCPPTKTGLATARSGKGGTSIAHSGSGDTYTLQQPSEKK